MVSRWRRSTRGWICERTTEAGMKTFKALVFVLCLVPVFLLGWRALHNGLGANPIEFITHSTGDWTLQFLVITLAITPLRKLLGLPILIRFRRMTGLFAFF